MSSVKAGKSREKQEVIKPSGAEQAESSTRRTGWTVFARLFARIIKNHRDGPGPTNNDTISHKEQLRWFVLKLATLRR